MATSSDPDEEGKRARERDAFQSERDEHGHPLYFEAHVDGRMVETFTGEGPSLAWLQHIADQPTAPTPRHPPLCNRCLAAAPLGGMQWCGACGIRAQAAPAVRETPEEAHARGERLRYLTARAAAAATGADNQFAPDAGDVDMAELIELWVDAGGLEIPFPDE